MGADRLRDGIAEQFSYRSERSDIWRLFDLLLETDAYLNLGYSAWYQPHVLGSPQRRLVSVVGETLAARLPETEGSSLLDVGCGRGGPAIHLTEQYGFEVTGIDLVPYNVDRARMNARDRGLESRFLVGDAATLPLSSAAVRACTAVDSLVYVPDRNAVFAELERVLEPGGFLVLSDLVRTADAGHEDPKAVKSFAAAWDMPPPGTVPEYMAGLRDAGFEVVAIRDLSPHSVGRFRKWTTLHELLASTPIHELLGRGLERLNLDYDSIASQIRQAHEALPALGHVLVVARARR